jgi:hypothetical protein
VAVARLLNPPRIDMDIPAGLAGLLTAMTHNDPAQRPVAGEVAGRLREFHELGDEASGATTTELVNLPAPVRSGPESPDIGVPAHPRHRQGPQTAAPGALEALAADFGVSTLLDPPPIQSVPTPVRRHASANRRRRSIPRTDPYGLPRRAVPAVSGISGVPGPTGSGELPHRRDLRGHRRGPSRAMLGLAVLTIVAVVSVLVIARPFGG